MCLKLTIKIAGRRQCSYIAIFTVTFNCNCLLVIIFHLGTVVIIEICQIFSSSVLSDSVEAEVKPVNQRNLARQMKDVGVDISLLSSWDELRFIIFILAWVKSSKLIWAWLVNFSFSSSVLLGGAHSGIANYIWLDLDTVYPTLVHICWDKLILFVASVSTLSSSSQSWTPVLSSKL